MEKNETDFMWVQLNAKQVRLYEGFTKYAIWPSSISTGNDYSLLSKTQITSLKPTSQVLNLPYSPGFIYAAYESEAGSEVTEWTLYHSMPKFLEHHIYVLDVSGKEYQSNVVQINEDILRSPNDDCDVKQIRKTQAQNKINNLRKENLLSEGCNDQNYLEKIVSLEKETNNLQTDEDVKNLEITEEFLDQSCPNESSSFAQKPVGLLRDGIEASANLMSVEFSGKNKRKISALKFPCFLPPSNKKTQRKKNPTNLSMGGKYKSERENIVTTKNLYSEVQVSKNSKGTKKDDVDHHNYKPNVKAERCPPQQRQFKDWEKSRAQYGYYKDRNLKPSKKCQQLSIHLRHTSIIEVSLNTNEMIGPLKKKFCLENELNISQVRFLLNGQRIKDTDTAETLHLSEGDFIDVFLEMKGGGWFANKNNGLSDEEILKRLQENIGSNRSDEEEYESKKGDEASMIAVSKDSNVNPIIDDLRVLDNNSLTSLQQKLQNEGDECPQDSNLVFFPPESLTCDKIYKKSLRKSKEKNTIDINNTKKEKTQTEVSKIEKCEQEQDYTIEDKSCQDENLAFISDLRSDFQKGIIDKDNKYDKKIIHFLNQKTLAPVEIHTLKLLVERKSCLESIFPETSSKKKRLQKSENENLDLQLEQSLNRINEPSESSKKVKNLTYEKSVDNSNSSTTILSRFGITDPSPIKKSKKVIEDEMKRISAGIHFWAESTKGGTSILHRYRLKDTDFQSIIDFAGPESCYKIIKHRSSFQLKQIWRNIAKSEQYFRGHPETGYEAMNKFHHPSSQYCPFQHCQAGNCSVMSPLDIDLCLITPKTTRERKSKKSGYQRRQLIFDENEGYKKSAAGNKSFDESSTTKEDVDQRNKHSEENKENISDREKESFLVMKCNVKDCDKQFRSSFGLLKHQKKEHQNENIGPKAEMCKICGKLVIQMDKHIRTRHKTQVEKNVCEICEQVIEIDIKKHRGQCKHCPVCGKTEKSGKKQRLLKHIIKCKQMKMKYSEQTSPIDYSTPKKNNKKEASEFENNTEEFYKQSNVQEMNELNKPNNVIDLSMSKNEERKGQQEDIQGMKNVYHTKMDENTTEHVATNEDTENIPKVVNLQCSSRLDQKRTKFPFDDDNEPYYSEHECGDSKEFTRKRRKIKDTLELKLREIDRMQCTEYDGDDEIITKFRSFMEKQYNIAGHKGKKNQPSTISMYTNAVSRDILRAFHELFTPFNSCWILDCTTPKVYKFEGKEPRFLNPEEPIYLTSRVLRKALERYDRGETGDQRATLIAATRQFMNFIEMEFNDKLSLYGHGPLKRVITYHAGVKAFIDGTKTWRACNKEKEKTRQDNKALKSILNPNYEADILEEFKRYIKSEDRLLQIKKIISLANPSSPKATSKEFNECGQICMGEIVISTGCRPVVAYRLTNFGYTNKKSGFNPLKVTLTDRVIDEEENDQQIYRRVNPNLPPRDLACEHQLSNNSAICPVLCAQRCDPEGFNVLVNWDKTSEKMGTSYLHLAKTLKHLLDLYDIIKTKYFKGRQSAIHNDDEWLEDEDTPFFLNSSGLAFKQIDLKHISTAMGIDVSAYAFRRIISTWALSHKLEEIRGAESEALQHSFTVARGETYQQNKQIKPQVLTQTYIEEEGLYPESVTQEITEMETSAQKSIAQTEEKRQKKMQRTLLREKEFKQQLLQEHRRLGPRHVLLTSDKNRFKELAQQIACEDIMVNLKAWNPEKWRNYLVRLVCSTDGELGDQIRKVWIKVYRGDLKYGVRDARLKAKANNWPRRNNNACTTSRDRNSWIAATFLKSFQADEKKEKKTFSILSEDDIQ